MSAPQTRSTNRPQPPAGRRRLLAAAVALVVVAGLAAWLVLTSGSDRAPSSAAGTSGSAPATSSSTAPPSPVELGSAEPTDVPRTVLADVPGLPANLAPVALGGSSTFANGVTARLVSIDAVDAQGRGPGEVSGPALAVTVELANGGTAPVSLDTVAVNVFAGPDGAPAAPIGDGATAPLAGELAAGAAAQATYTFTVPVELRDVVVVSVAYAAGSGTAVFSGPAA